MTPESERLASFIRSRGGLVHARLELFGRSSDSRERGVFAVGPICQGEPLLRLPRAAVLCACENGPECTWMPEAARAMSATLRTSLFLMREQALGERSAWAAYLCALPESYDTLENWSLDELEALRGTSVYDELSGLRDASGSLVGAVQVVWSKEVLPLVTSHPELWPDATLGAFLRACAAVRTRGFFDSAAGGEGGCVGPYLLPAIDMLNHARAGQATSLVVERRGGGEGDEGGEGGEGDEGGEGGEGEQSEQGAEQGGASSLLFSMDAERDLARGEEALHTYDVFSDAQLLLTYGFVSGRGEVAL